MFHAACVPGNQLSVEVTFNGSNLFTVAHTTPLRSGQVSVVMRRFDLEQFLSLVGRFNINEFGVVPPIFIAIIMSPLAKKYSLKGVRSVTSGAAPLGKESQARFKQLLAPGTTVNQVWGMTESELPKTPYLHRRCGQISRHPEC